MKVKCKKSKCDASHRLTTKFSSAISANLPVTVAVTAFPRLILPFIGTVLPASERSQTINVLRG